MARYETTMEVERGDEALVVVQVMGTWCPGEPGGWEHPGEPAHWEDIEAAREDGGAIGLTADEERMAEEALEEARRLEEEGRAVARWEGRRDG